MSSGRLMVVEDFFPLSESTALITQGPTFSRLERIDLVNYAMRGNQVVLLKDGRHRRLATGIHLRLGGVFAGRLMYSDEGKGIVGSPVYGKTAHQPCIGPDGSLYYTDYTEFVLAPEHVAIYRDGQPFVPHFGEYIQVGNPCWAGEILYFEARKTIDPERPDLWEIWRRSPQGALQFVRLGANPATWGGWLFWAEWIARRFIYFRELLG